MRKPTKSKKATAAKPKQWTLDAMKLMSQRPLGDDIHYSEWLTVPELSLAHPWYNVLTEREQFTLHEMEALIVTLNLSCRCSANRFTMRAYALCVCRPCCPCR